MNSGTATCRPSALERPRLLVDDRHLELGLERVVRADLRAEAVLERRDDAAAVRVVLGVRRRDEHDVERQADLVAADLHVALFEHVEQADLDALGEVGQLVDREDAAVGARDEAVVDRQLVGEVAALGDLDRVDLADEVGDRRVGRRELLAEATVAVHPLDRRLVAALGDAACRACDEIGWYGSSLISLPATIGIHSSSRFDERADDARLRLAALAEEDHVVAGEQRVRELRQHGVFVADDAVDERFARRQLAHRVRADLFLDWPRRPAAGAKVSEGCGAASCGRVYVSAFERLHSRTNVPAVDLTGPWSARPGDGDLAKQFADPAFDDTGLEHGRAPPSLAHGGRVRVRGRTVALPSHASTHPAPAAGRRSFLELRRRLLLRRRLARRRLPRRHRGLLRPARVRGHRSAPTRSPITCSRSRSPVPPQRDRTAKRTITGAVRTLGRGRSRVQPRRTWRPMRIAETGRVRIANLRVLCTEALDERGRLTCDGHARRGDGPLDAVMHARHRRPTRARRCSMRSVRSRSRAGENRQSWTLTVDDAPRWWPRSLGAQPLLHAFAVACRGRRRAERRTDRAHGVSRRPRSTTGSSRSTASDCSSRAPTSRRRAWRSPTPPSTRSGATSCSRRTRTSTSCACTRTSPGRSSTTPPTSSACSCGRTSRCSGATHAAYAARRPARRARWSTCSVTTRACSCGARTTRRSPPTANRANRGHAARC